MNRRVIRRLALALIALIALPLAMPGVSAAAPGASPERSGSMVITFAPDVTARMFKAGVFVYNVSSVGVGMSDSGSLSVTIPLEGSWKGRATSSAAMDPETGAIQAYNGPAGLSVGIGDFAIRRTGATGTVRARLVGPYSADSGQWSQSVSLFTLSRASGKQQRCGWSMRGAATLTPEAAALLNERLATTSFVANAPAGEVQVTVGSCER